MIKHIEPDRTLIKMPSLTVMKSFVAAARYQKFTRAIHKLNREQHSGGGMHTFIASDYNMLVQMALNDQGIALGWDHLVSPLVANGRLVRLVEKELVLEGTRHYLAYREDKEDDETLSLFRDWFVSQSDRLSISSCH